ncbi:DUF2336 domain-containing protein [Pelagibius sp. 7325]|uniref:DUF2336 domain-containing protein n=1 Tax=Pelagibius sp. 7325 TaxID=3131994 RepID=UPI0030EDC67F
MGSARGRRGDREAFARPGSRAAALLRRILLLVSLAVLSTPVAAAREAGPALTAADIEAALVQMEALGAFFAAVAGRETNEAASARWYRLGINYKGTAAVLRRALLGDSLVIEDLPDGRRVALAEAGRIAIDDTLDGGWEDAADAEASEVLLRDSLMPALFEALAQRRLPQDWPWLADHLRAVGGLVAPSQDPMGRPLLARYFQAKDAYLWLALRRIGEGDPAARQGFAQRQRATFETVRGLESQMAAILGAAEAERLQRDWSASVAQVDGFAVTRGWVLLDPALRRTQLGAAAREAADAVDQAAAEVVAAAPRSALAAARVEGREPRPTTAAPHQDDQSVNLGALVAQTPGSRVSAAPPDAAAARAAIAVHGFPPRNRVTAGEPGATPVIAAQDEALDGARRQVATLEAKVGELAAALEARAQEAARLEAALARERERSAAAERERQAAAAREREAEAQQRRAVEAAAQQATAEAVPPAQPVAETAEKPAVSPLQLDQRQIYVVGAVAVLVMLVLLIWLRGRRRTAAVVAPQRLLTSPDATASTARDAPLPQRPVIEVPARAPTPEPAPIPEPVAEPVSVPEPAFAAAPSAVPRIAMSRLPEGARIRVDGVTPPTAAARAAMQAATARRGAAQGAAPAQVTAAEAGAEEGAEAAQLGSEADTAAHPIVHALRRGNLPLFELLFSELTALRSPQLQRIVYGGRGEDLAIVCRAVGVDKLLFGSIFLLTDHLRGGSREEEPERTAAMLQMYDRMPPATAQKVLAKWQRNWSGQRRGSMPDVH